ncbi:hypothetical protein [Mycolicibacterium fortuitum]|uniref:Uncharacterized protein n=2 Tax=Mycolicibacterium fortuitum TaxID=1766 RepID=A0AAE4VIL5_MYCFO|nr:hypothetical protein [Mycolicibacterium fortuitum]MCV7144242.1 hypothetical protein [Mycolicibacterium fortuitum]MDV7195368.1 hypothetical protein [Mycolicibacterium fortuitum]MDV7209047.1 hypothetical protein [Mycolicibacterium fortuitum]MDV7230911.1 hypothetical protein [Mycolicibacterium fortuitum]MDV7262482.1 hypothetical protein [Mycolicibacterium fortuitum]
MATSASRSRNLDISPSIAAVRTYTRAVKIACDELHDDPFDVRARAALLKLIVEDSPEADDAFTRALAENSAGTVGD